MRVPPFVQPYVRSTGPWLLLAVWVGVVLLLCLRALDPPPARVGPERAEQFSEPRARAVVEHLSEDIGIRLNGTPAHRRAAEFLASELRKIPGFEVEIQEAEGTRTFSSV